MPFVWLPVTLRSELGGDEPVHVDGTTMREVIDALDVRFPGIKRQLCEGDDLRPGFAVAIDNQVSRAGLWQLVGEESEIHFIRSIAGGADQSIDPFSARAAPAVAGRDPESAARALNGVPRGADILRRRHGHDP